MRGGFVDQGWLFSYISAEARVPANHPLRAIRAVVRDVLATPQDLDALAMPDEQAWLSERQEFVRSTPQRVLAARRKRR
jgi:hypothetical protein